MHENEIASGVVEAAFRVHRLFGPGLLESVYETCLEFELKDMGFDVRRQVHLPVQYRGMQLDAAMKGLTAYFLKYSVAVDTVMVLIFIFGFFGWKFNAQFVVP
jgi:GxxExxY protein